MTENYVPASSPPWEEPSAELPLEAVPASGLPGSAAPDNDAGQGPADVVRDQAADLGQGAVDAGKHAAGVARDQASGVVAEAGQQGRELLRQAQDQLQSQASMGQQRLASDLHALSDGFCSMADQAGQPGLAADLARQAAGTARNVARWLDDREPGQVLEDVKSFARRRPGMFVALAACAGLMAGRLTRGLTDASSDEGNAGSDEGSWGPATDASPAVPDIGDGATTLAGAGYQPSADLGATAGWDAAPDSAAARAAATPTAPVAPADPIYTPDAEPVSGAPSSPDALYEDAPYRDASYEQGADYEQGTGQRASYEKASYEETEYTTPGGDPRIEGP